MKCIVPNCYNNTKRLTRILGVTFHLLPKEPDIREAWVSALGIPNWQTADDTVICSDHFKDEDFYETKTGIRKVSHGALPFIMSKAELRQPAALRVCKICLSLDRKMNLMNDDLDQMFEQITGITTFMDDRLPQGICWECTARLSAAASLRARAIRSDGILEELLATSPFINVHDIKSVNREEKGLKTNLCKILHDNEHFNVHILENLLDSSDESNDQSQNINNEVMYNPTSENDYVNGYIPPNNAEENMDAYFNNNIDQPYQMYNSPSYNLETTEYNIEENIKMINESLEDVNGAFNNNNMENIDINDNDLSISNLECLLRGVDTDNEHHNLNDIDINFDALLNDNTEMETVKETSTILVDGSINVNESYEYNRPQGVATEEPIVEMETTDFGNNSLLIEKTTQKVEKIIRKKCKKAKRHRRISKRH